MSLEEPMRFHFKDTLVPILMLLALCLAAAAPVAAGTASIRGSVTDGGTGAALFSANVVLSNASGQTVNGRLTGESGKFVFADLAAGTYSVRVSYMGYSAWSGDVTVSGGEAARISVELSETAFEMDAVQVTASRRPEKIVDAPAAVHVVNQGDIQSRETLTPADHLTTVPGVDVVRAGINQSNVVVRGFNNVFSGATLTLVDNRIARVPSLRVNAYQFIPTPTEEFERIEVVSGPGSALYGPNSANGVVHMVTRSPFSSEGTTVSVAAGTRNIITRSIRHAVKLSDRAAFRVSLQHQEGEDWEYVDPVEQYYRQVAIDDGADPATLLIGARDYHVDRLGVEGRLDVHLTPEATFILNGGVNEASNIEMTGLGTGQVKDYQYSYAQGRLLYRDWFLQSFVNQSDAGDTYLLRTGAPIVDESKLFVTQIQHGAALGANQDFTYGVDILNTRPDTRGTINGRNEESDAIDEFGAYLQSETRLGRGLKLVAAARLDDHSHLEDRVFSPRAAVVFGPTDAHTVRATFNRAFSTPTSNNLFLDLLALEDLGGLGMDLWAKGVPADGFTFARNDALGGVGGLFMQSPFTPDILGGPAQPLPADATLMWEAIQAIMLAQGVDISGIPDPAVIAPGTVGTTLRVLNTTSGEFDEVDPSYVTDVDRIRPTITETMELGYKGMVGSRISVAVDLYHSKVTDFVSALRVETPNVFYDPATLAAYLGGLGLPPDQVASLAEGIAGIPVGTITPEGSEDPTDLIMTYRNFGDFDLDGLDLSVQCALSRLWTAGFNYSHVTKDVFTDDGGMGEIALNSPKNKAGATLAYHDAATGFNAKARLRWVESFPVNSGAFVGTVDEYTTVDLTAGYRIGEGTRVDLTVQNLLDNLHQEIIGAPELGRLAMLRISQSF
ncbi:MAG: hypothetical protein CME07_02990 [Gemmatimonadetes bacterium]|nr:hypothetical protein [Gemmatimonadota bacterium]